MSRALKPRPKYLPVDDAYLPLSKRRFPFRAAGPHEVSEANQAIGEAIRAVENMIYRGIIKGIRKGRLSPNDKEDVAQLCRIHLMTVSLPRYDRARPNQPKVSTFLHICINHYLLQASHSHTREQARRPLSIHSIQSIKSARPSSDRQIEQLAERIRSNPDEYLTPSQAGIFRALIGQPKTSLQLAATFGYRKAVSISAIKRRILNRIIAVAADLPIAK